MEIPVDGGQTHVFKSLPLDEERGFLGVFDSPEVGNKKQLKKIFEKVSAWNQRMRNGHLFLSLGWIAYKHKL